MCVIKFLGRGSCILRWLRRRVGERLGELRALMGKLLTRRPKSVLGELFQASRGRAARLANFSLAIRTARHYYARQGCPRPPLRKLRGPLFRDAPATTFGIAAGLPR